jgi:tetratricopeptide (TPR) repeat protein
VYPSSAGSDTWTYSAVEEILCTSLLYLLIPTKVDGIDFGGQLSALYNWSNMFGNGEGGFNGLLQEAAKIKGAQMATMRTDWDKRPQFFQNTLFHGQSVQVVKDGRKLPCAERLKLVHCLKTEATKLFQEKKYTDALVKYEHALAVVHYVQPNRDDWKTRGLLDDDLDIVDYSGDATTTDEEKAKLNTLKSVLYSNIGTCHFLLDRNDRKLTIAACNYALQQDDSNVKALYRRAMSYIEAPTSGGMELGFALRDLKKAFNLDPSNQRVRKELHSLKIALKKQKETDRSNYTGLFDRGEVCNDENEETYRARQQAKRKRQQEENRQVIKQIEGWKERAAALERMGRVEEAAKFRAKYEEGKSVIDKWEKERLDAAANEMDFNNPSQQMIDDAAQHGLDLNDPAVRKYMQQMHEERAGAAMQQKGEGGSPKGSINDLRGDRNGMSTTVDWRVFVAIFVLSVLTRYLWSLPNSEIS